MKLICVLTFAHSVYLKSQAINFGATLLFVNTACPALAFILIEYKHCRVLTWTKCNHWQNVFYHNNQAEENRADTLAHIFSPPLCLFILPSFYLSDSPNIVPPPLHRELICRNIPAAHCDHLVNTPIILSASASHPAMEMTPWGWQFNLPVTDGGYHGSTRAPAFSCWLLFLLAKREMLPERVPAFTPLDSSGASSPQHHCWSSGERCCHLFMWPCQYPITHTRSPPLCTYQANYSSITTTRPSHLPVLSYWSISLVMMPLSLLSLPPQHAIDILPPSSCLLPNDFLLPLASFPLSSSALHKSTRSLDPSKANDNHLFSSTPVSFFLSICLWVTFFCFHMHIHSYTHVQHACARTRTHADHMLYY